jgi:hypothetical protein
VDSNVLSVLLVVSLLVAGAVGTVGTAGAVPDARITIDAVTVTPSEPVVGERTQLNVTVANSGGSPDAGEVTAVRLRDADDTTLDEASTPGSLSAGDTLETKLWTTFETSGEHRLTVEVVVDEAVGDDEDADTNDPPTVRVTTDVIVDVAPAEPSIALRARPLAPEDLQTDEDNSEVNVGGVNGINGILGGGGGGLETSDDEPMATAMDGPVAITVVNTGTVSADRVSVTASGAAVAGTGPLDASGDATASDTEATTDDASADTFAAGPFVVEDVAPGEERRVVVDLGSLDRQTDVTFTADFRATAGPPADDGTTGSATVDLVYPQSDGRPVVTDAIVTRAGEGSMTIDANLANAGSHKITGVVVSVGDTAGVEATPAGGGYFIGGVASDDFVPFELTVDANTSAAKTIPVEIAYTDRGVRYVETVSLETPAPPQSANESATGTATVFGGVGAIGSLGGEPAGLGWALAVGGGLAAVVGAVVRRRDV